MTMQTVAESSAVYCNCQGAVTGDVEQMCEQCLDAYLDAVIQGTTGQARLQEIARVLTIVKERLDKDPDLADDVRGYLLTQATLARPTEN